MIYLDYSATTPVNDEVLDTFNKVSKDFIGNANSLHKLGMQSKALIDSATKQICNIFHIKESELIYTSGASEANNTIIKGICASYPNKKHILTTYFEHSSINSPLDYLKSLGYEIEYLNHIDGLIDLEELKGKLRADTCLVIVSAVNSEIGLLQPINEIGRIVKRMSHALFFSDITQLIGKKHFSLENVDLASFSAHKFYGIKGIGGLIKKESIPLVPLIMGGKSTTSYRSGTPSPSLIASMAKALRISNDNLNNNEQVEFLSKYLKDRIIFDDNIYINSNINCIPHIINISIVGIKPETLLHALEEHDIYISTKTACAKDDDKSIPVYALTQSEQRALSSIRISLSFLTTKEEIDLFLKVFEQEVKRLLNISQNM